MEDQSFDELTKKLASPISRRGVLKAFVASVAGTVLVQLDGARALAVDPGACRGPTLLGCGGQVQPGVTGVAMGSYATTPAPA
jgi:hypothetical protein